MIQKMHNITPEKDKKDNPNNEYWYYGKCSNIFIDKIKYEALIKLVKKVGSDNPRLYVYFLEGLKLKKVD